MNNIRLNSITINNSLLKAPAWPFDLDDISVYMSAIWQLWDLESSGCRKISQYQQERLKQLLYHMHKLSPWWRSRIPSNISSLDSIPILTRTQLREQVSKEGPLRASDKVKVNKNSTSGSSGQPLYFYSDEHNGKYNIIRYCMEILVQHRDLSLPKTSVKRYEKDFALPRWNDLAGILFKTGPHRGLDNRTHSIPEIANWLESAPIGYLHIMPQYLQALFFYYEKLSKPIPKVREIISLGGTVYPEFRKLVYDKMGAEIKDIYSCQEAGPIAFQCPKRADMLHVASPSVVVESIGNEGKASSVGIPGRILITSLQNFATPIVRYEIGDIATLLPSCPCGHQGQTMTNLLGLASTLLKTPEGLLRPFYLVAKDWLAIASLKEYRVTQDANDHLLVELSTDKPLTQQQKEAFTALVRSRTSELFKVTILELDFIDWGGSYKKNQVRCLV